MVDGVPLRTLASSTTEEEPDTPPFDVGAEILRATREDLQAAKEEEKTLDGVSLVALGPTKVGREPETSLVVFFVPAADR